MYYYTITSLATGQELARKIHSHLTRFQKTITNEPPRRFVHCRLVQTYFQLLFPSWVLGHPRPQKHLQYYIYYRDTMPRPMTSYQIFRLLQGRIGQCNALQPLEARLAKPNPPFPDTVRDQIPPPAIADSH